MSLKQMKDLAQKALAMQISLNRPYKCCDFKSVYGLIFKDYINGYDYWGHCDFDLIFGDLSAYFEKYNLKNYDRFLALGHLSLYKNTDVINHRYKCKGGKVDYVSAFQKEPSAVFDEMPGMTAIYLFNDFPFFTKNVFADIASVYKRYRIIEKYSLDEKKKNYKYQVFYWEEGKVYRAYYNKGVIYTEEYMYIHFKKRPNFAVNFDVNKTQGFYITNRGFVVKDGPVTLKSIKKNNPFRGRAYELCERIRFWFSGKQAGLRRRIRHLFRTKN
jgi:hypothetical protein